MYYFSLRKFIYMMKNNRLISIRNITCKKWVIVVNKILRINYVIVERKDKLKKQK